MAGPTAKAFADLVDLVDTMVDHLGAISESLSSLEQSMADIAAGVVDEELEEEEPDVVTAGETASVRD